MKIIALFCCMLLFLIGCSIEKQSAVVQGSLTGLLNIHWGDSRDSAKSKMLAMEGVEFVADSAATSFDPINSRFRGGSFMGHEVQEWVLSFWKNRNLWSALIQFKHDSASSTSFVDDLEWKLRSQYGNAPESRIWRFAVQGEEKANVVRIFPDSSGAVAVVYAAYGYVDSLERSLK